MAKETSRIAVTEKNRSFAVIVPRGCGADTIHIDSPEYARLERRCDYAIRVSPGDPRHFFFVELKGNDALYAAEQLASTISALRGLYAAYADRQAWVIAKNYPTIVTTQLQKIKRRVEKASAFVLKWKTRSFEVSVA